VEEEGIPVSRRKKVGASLAIELPFGIRWRRAILKGRCLPIPPAVLTRLDVGALI